MVPSWGELISLLPYVLIIGVIGPIISIIALLWVWHLLHRSRGRVRRVEAQAIAAPRGEDGAAIFGPNVPYCEAHALIYPPHATTCQIDRADLSVTCPVDDTVRAASVEICPACGTRYVLGATSSPLAVVAPSGPPEGGAAVA
jgi:hypothetical protein